MASTASFTHYLRPEDGDQAKSVWSAVASNNDPTNAPYTFSVRCAKDDDNDCKASSSSLVITDARPQDGDTLREMKICPLFFRADVTQNNLDSRTYDGDKRGSWCQSGQHFKDFETAGHTLLHEMTHLDALGKSAGVPEHQWVIGPQSLGNIILVLSDLELIWPSPLPRDPGGFSTHGTDDVDGFGDDYVTAARALASTWMNDPNSLDPNALKPYQNAENIAAAATGKIDPPKMENGRPRSVSSDGLICGVSLSLTEWWFLASCKFDNIDL